MDSAIGNPTPLAAAKVGIRASGSLLVADGTIECLKWLAVILMALDHANKYLAGGKVVWAFAAGRACLPLFCFVLAYNLTRVGVLENGGFGRVMRRTALAGAIATPIFIVLGGLLFGWWPLNIMFTLCVATMMLLFVARGGWGNYVIALLIFLIGGALVESLRDRFPAACGVDFMDERLYPQEPQCNGVDVPHRISGEVPTSGV